MYTRAPLGRQLGDERFGPATSQMMYLKQSLHIKRSLTAHA